MIENTTYFTVINSDGKEEEVYGCFSRVWSKYHHDGNFLGRTSRIKKEIEKL